MVSLAGHIEAINAILSNREDYSYSDPRNDYIAMLTELGFKPPSLLQVGGAMPMRFPAPGDKPGKKNGWAFYNEVEDSKHPGRVLGVGTYGDWKSGQDPQKWFSREYQKMTPAQKQGFEEKLAEQQRLYDAEQARSQREAAGVASEILQYANPVVSHSYLTRKKIKAYDWVRVANSELENERPGDLVIPIINTDNEVMSLQFIRPDGTKRMMTGGKKQSCFFKISGQEDVIYICEGYATAASVHEATGKSVYISFDIGNLYNVASHAKDTNEKSRIVIAGDDDIYKPINAGRTKAETVAGTLHIECVFPSIGDGQGKDWNDLACFAGLDEVKRQLEFKPEPYEVKQEVVVIDEPEFGYEPPKGMLREVYNYFNMTSGQDQRGFAVQVALALVSVMVARNFKTVPHNNMSSLYLLCIGKSSTGKEHSRKVIQDILDATNRNNLLGNSGYTSDTGVLSDLWTLYPRHINIIDEFGRHLETAKKSGDALTAGANTKLMEAFGQLNGQMSPKGYSTINLSKEKQKEMQNRRMYNPGITLFAMTVPNRFYNALDVESVRDGFLGRFLIYESEAPRTVWMPKENTGFPEAIKEWVKRIDERIGPTQEIASMKPTFIEIRVSPEAEKIRQKYAQECNEEADNLEPFGLAELTGKAAEIMMRVAMIAALARDPNTDIVKKEDAMWAYSYVKRCFDNTFRIVKTSVSGSQFEANKLEALQSIRKMGSVGYTTAELNKKKPFGTWQPQQLKDIMNSLLEGEMVAIKQEDRNGKMTKVWYAI